MLLGVGGCFFSSCLFSGMSAGGSLSPFYFRLVEIPVSDNLVDIIREGHLDGGCRLGVGG